jgi:hypothetical protein
MLGASGRQNNPENTSWVTALSRPMTVHLFSNLGLDALAT